MPVRGYVRSKLWYFLKIGAMNSTRVLEWTKKQASFLFFCSFYAFHAVAFFFSSENRQENRRIDFLAVS